MSSTASLFARRIVPDVTDLRNLDSSGLAAREKDKGRFIPFADTVASTVIASLSSRSI
jgi:hypothetical protein